MLKQSLFEGCKAGLTFEKSTNIMHYNKIIK